MSGNPSSKRIRTLVVEGSAPVQRAICLFLEGQRGIEIVGTARDGCEALEKVEILKPDLLLTDWQMPEMDGLELALKVHNLYPAIRLILITEYDSPDVRMASQLCGADGFVGTGNLYQELAHELRRIFPGPNRK